MAPMNKTPTPLKIDFVSDVSCPWCAIGLHALETALQRVAPDVTAELHFQPFELNPQMPPGGQDITEHLTEKYGSTPEKQAEIREMIRQRGAEVGFEFRREGRGRIYNTFDAHRLLHWAGTIGAGEQRALKEALFVAHFTEGRRLTDPEVLADAAAAAGLDRAKAVEVLADDLYAAEVRAAEALWVSRGISGVPAVVVEGKWLISGGQPAGVFEEALRGMAGETSAA